ncbi:MAG: BlaI/MecI/CopY family transcriptional regulator [Acidobacteriota bacterium]
MPKPNESRPKGRPAARRAGRCSGPNDLSRLELECMRAVWLQGAETVSAVQHILHPHRPLAYTTVLTILDRLTQKGAVERIKHGKTYYYSPALSFADARQAAVSHLLDFYFNGSRAELMGFLKQGENPGSASETGQNDSDASPSSSEMNDCLL